MQQKMARCNREAMNLLKEEAPLSVRNYMVKTSVRIEWIWKAETAVLDTRAEPHLLKGGCLLWPWARHAVTMKTERSRLAADTQLEVKKMIRLKAQLGQSKAKVSFFIVTGFANNMVLGIASSNENIGKISPSNGTLKLNGSSIVPIEESVSILAHMTIRLKSKQSHPEDELSHYQCAAVFQRTISLMSEEYLNVRSSV